MYVALDHKDWDINFPSATYAYNTSLYKTTGDTLFFLTYAMAANQWSYLMLHYYYQWHNLNH